MQEAQPISKNMQHLLSNKIGLCVLGLMLGVLLSSGCKKDEVLADPIPFIKLESINPTTVQEFSDNITMVLSYDDGDGDLGFSNADSLALEVHDSRLTNPDFYHVQNLAPEDQVLHIRGTIQVIIDAPFLLGTGATEIIHYKVRIKDRAGNWSNIVTTPDITITQ